jgi:hypothetical protein
VVRKTGLVFPIPIPLKQPGLSSEHVAELDALTALELRSAEQVEALVATISD